jgi:hypothetical protein
MAGAARPWQHGEDGRQSWLLPTRAPSVRDGLLLALRAVN